MTKRLVDLDDDLVEYAKRELGTTTLVDTLHAALREATAIRARSRQVEWLTRSDAYISDRDQMDLDSNYPGSRVRLLLRKAAERPGGPRPTRT